MDVITREIGVDTENTGEPSPYKPPSPARYPNR